MMTDLARLPALLTAAALLIGGTVKSADPGLSAALFAAGFILLGAWLVLEVQAHRRRTGSDSKQLTSKHEKEAEDDSSQ